MCGHKKSLPDGETEGEYSRRGDVQKKVEWKESFGKSRKFGLSYLVEEELRRD